MRLVKMFVLSALAAVTALALIAAAAQASEDTEVVFCKENVELCPESKIAAPEKFTGTAVNPVLLSSVVNVECPSATLEGQTLASMSANLPFDVTELFYGTGLGKGCKGCTEVHTTTPTTPYKGTITVASVEGKDVYTTHVAGSALLLHCTIFNVECKFESTSLLGTITNTAGGAQIVTYKKAKVNRVGGSGLCPEFGELDATFEEKAVGGARWLSLFLLTP